MDIRLAQNFQDLAACIYIRTEVFCYEQGNSFAQQFGDEDERRHLIAYIGAEPAGTVRFYAGIDDTEKGYIERLAVLEKFRKNEAKIGSSLMQKAAEILKAEHGVSSIEISAQDAAAEVYTKLGYTQVGQGYEDGGMPHHKMILEVLIK